MKQDIPWNRIAVEAITCNGVSVDGKAMLNVDDELVGLVAVRAGQTRTLIRRIEILRTSTENFLSAIYASLTKKIMPPFSRKSPLTSVKAEKNQVRIRPETGILKGICYSGCITMRKFFYRYRKTR